MRLYAINTKGRQDILRKEAFGSIIYSRFHHEYRLLTKPETALLQESALVPIQKLKRTAIKKYGFTKKEFENEVALWRSDQFFDKKGYCHPRVVDRPHHHTALSAPFRVSIEITDGCNLSCSHCYVERSNIEKRNEIPIEILRRLFAELDTIGCPHVNITGGEPLLHKDFWSITEALEQNGLEAKLCTNAILITPEIAKRLVEQVFFEFSVSLDGADKDTHDALRGTGAFLKTCRGIRELAKANPHLLRLRVTASKQNIDKLSNLGMLAADLGVKYVSVKPFRLNGAVSNAKDLVVSPQEFTDAMKSLEDDWPQTRCKLVYAAPGAVRFPDWTSFIPRFGCVGGNCEATIRADGKVAACASVPTEGEWNIQSQTFLECWDNSPAMAHWRTLPAISECETCEFLNRCGGGCRARADATNQKAGEPDRWCCDSFLLKL